MLPRDETPRDGIRPGPGIGDPSPFARFFSPSTRGTWALLAAVAVLFAARAFLPPVEGGRAAALRYALLLCGAAAVGAAAIARRLRGRFVWIDLAHVVLWMHPWQTVLLAGSGAPWAVPISAAASALLLCAVKGPRALGSAVADFARRHVNQRNAGLALLVVTFWLMQALVPLEVAADGLDHSWAQGLGYALTHGLRAGHDWMFTAGPLGYFNSGSYDAGLFWTRMAVWECGVELVIAALIALSVLRIDGVLQRTVYVLLILVLLTESDSAGFVAILAATTWLLDRPSLTRGAAALVLVLLPLLSLTKFTLLVLGAGCSGAIAIVLWREFSWRAAAAWIGLYATSFLCLWLLAGQNLLDLPRYLSMSWEISSGYNEAMALPGREDLTQYAWYSLAIVGGLGALHALRRPIQPRLVAQAAVLALTTFVAYKAGFTRRDGHTAMFFACIGLLPFLMGDKTPLTGVRRMAVLAGRWTCVWIAYFGLIASYELDPFGFRHLVNDRANRAVSTCYFLHSPSEARKSGQTKRAEVQALHPLRRVREVVGNHSIDSMSWEQGLLFLHDMNWKPRLTLQGYSAYTPRLQAENAAYLAAADGPEFLLFRLQSIDEKLPTMDDSAAIQIAARDYRPVLRDGERILLRRDPQGPRKPAEVVLSREIAFGETVDISQIEGRCLLLALDLRPTLLGRLATTLDQGPLVFVEITSSTGEYTRQRVVRGSIAEGAIISPLLLTQSDWNEWYFDGDLPRTATVSVMPVMPDWAYQPKIGLRILRADDVAPRKEPGLENELRSASTIAKCVGISTPKPAVRRKIRGLDALIVFTPSKLTYDVPPGKWAIETRFGLVQPDGLAFRSDGAGFEVSLESLSGEYSRVLYESYVKPADATRDAAHNMASLDVDAPYGARLVLKTTPGPAGDTQGDYAYWSLPTIVPRP
ncbi:MAG: hypothetical protein NTY35_02400 [Planctomycetota bacterium]|nr:hypothetical protein [Planctomycetota bacterium]